MDEANEAVSKAEAIRKFAILDSDFSEASGHLTPSPALKRNIVMRDFADEVERLLAEAAAPARTAYAGGAWVAAFAMLQWSVVRFEVPIVLTLTGCAALLGFSLAQRGGYAGSVPTAVVVAVLLSSALVTWRVPLFTYVPAGPRTAILVTIALAAVLTSLLLARPTRRRCVTAYGIAVLTIVAVAAQAIIADPTPRIDVWHLLNEGADVLKDGGNIYTATWPQSPGVKDAFTYLPWTLVLLAPGRWFAGDARWMLLIWSLVLLLALALLASGRPHAWWRAGVAAAADPRSSPDPSPRSTKPDRAAARRAPGAVGRARRPRSGLVGGHPACSPARVSSIWSSWSPLFLLWSRFGWKRTLATGALSAALIAPFALADLPAFVHDTITLLLGFHPIRVRQHLVSARAQRLRMDAAVLADHPGHGLRRAHRRPRRGAPPARAERTADLVRLRPARREPGEQAGLLQPVSSG